MFSNDEVFLGTSAIVIYNDRNQKDIAGVDDNLYSGLE